MLRSLLVSAVVCAAFPPTSRRASQNTVPDRGLVEASSVFTLIHFALKPYKILVVIRENTTRNLFYRVFVVSLHILKSHYQLLCKRGLRHQSDVLFFLDEFRLGAERFSPMKFVCVLRVFIQFRVRGTPLPVKATSALLGATPELLGLLWLHHGVTVILLCCIQRSFFLISGREYFAAHVVLLCHLF